MMRARILAVLLFVGTGLGCAQTRSSVEGRWEGEILLPGFPLTIRVEIASAGESLRATIDIPQQGATGLALKEVRLRDSLLHFELPAGPGLATFDGVMKGDSVSGDFRQAGFAGTFRMHRVAIVPQPPPVPPPYKELEVAFSSGDITLAGTLTLPEGRGPHPVLLLVSGSGPQNRDEEIFGFRPFRIIADTLTRLGLGVLRVDDRGVGKSGGSRVNATTDDFAADAAAAVRFLKGHPEIDPRRVGMLGHSEGGLVVAMAGETVSPAFAVLMAAPAIRGDSIILDQIKSIGAMSGETRENLEAQLALQSRVFAVARADTGWDTLRELLRKEMPKTLPDSTVDRLTEIKVQQVRSPWFRRFIDLDPAPLLREIRWPLLALFGEKDVQVPPARNRPAMERALKRGEEREVTVVEVKGANHLFQDAVTGSVNEYAALKKEFSPAFLEVLIPWVRTRAGLESHPPGGGKR